MYTFVQYIAGSHVTHLHKCHTDEVMIFSNSDTGDGESTRT